MSTDFLIQVEGRGDFRCRPDQNLVEAQAEMDHPLVPFSCRSGSCGSCRVKLVKGEVGHDAYNFFACSPQEEEEGFILACQSFPKGDLLLRVE